jgi:hypothetical protein
MIRKCTLAHKPSGLHIGNKIKIWFLIKFLGPGRFLCSLACTVFSKMYWGWPEAFPTAQKKNI